MVRPELALVLAAGDSPPARLLHDWAARAAWFVCADGALRTAVHLGARPQMVVGDLDSLGGGLTGVEVVGVPEQDSNDLEKCFRMVLERGYREVVVLGAGGGRWDQFHTNLSVFARFADRLSIQAGDAHGWLRLLPRGEVCAVAAGLDALVSLLPLPAAGGVTTRGLRWPLADATLRLGVADGMSNRVDQPGATVRYETGCLALYRPSAGE